MHNARFIDWDSNDSHILFNTRYGERDKQEFIQKFNNFPKLSGHLFVATSGTTKSPKWVAASKKAFLLSAAAVNNFLKLTSKDIWVNPLPHYHVGALGIFARAYLTDSKVFDYEGKWDAAHFCKRLVETKASITSLVPTQIFDLVQKKLSAPSSLHSVLVGGGALGSHLYQKARELGWPLLPTYGLTESVSQVATATSFSPALKILPHAALAISEEGHLMIKSDSLLTGYIEEKNGEFFLNDPKEEGWFKTEDFAEINNSSVTLLGRSGDIVKVAGEKVSQKKLEEVLQEVLLELNIPLEAMVKLLPDERLGFSVALFLAKKFESFSERIKSSFYERVLPYEKIRQVHLINEIVRTDLGKILYRS